MAVTDRFGRPLHDLRISVIDRCNFRCRYCMPREVFGADHVFLPQDSMLSFEEIVRIVRAGVSLGVRKIRLTGGEPLLRAGLDDLVGQLRAVPVPEDDRLDIALTTNGSLLARQAEGLAAAGLDRVTVSLDSLDEETFRAMSDVRMSVSKVLNGIDVAAAAGLRPKINTVVQRSRNADEIVKLARRFHGTESTVRFIEFMDVGTTNGWVLDEVVPSAEVIERINATMPLEPVDPTYRGEVARRWRYVDGGGEIGVISSITAPFCSTCTRARLSADGKIFTCLFASGGTDLKELIRSGADDDAIRSALAGIWGIREDRYSELRSAQTGIVADRAEMSYLGG